jgi:hypothetical protein
LKSTIAARTAIDLAGWALSDDADFPGQWVFPSRLLPAGQYLIVFASGLDIKNPTGHESLPHELQIEPRRRVRRALLA